MSHRHDKQLPGPANAYENDVSKHTPCIRLLELLVVIAIVGILIGMLLPAVQSVRESARQTVCTNNVRQIALAVHNFESAAMKFPVNQVGFGMPDGFGADLHAWAIPQWINWSLR